jgi:hypothetical protein
VTDKKTEAEPTEGEAEPESTRADETEAEPESTSADVQADEAELEQDAPAAPTETPEEEGARRLMTLAAALANLDDDSIARGVATMREQSRIEVAQQLNLSKATIRLGSALVPLFRRKVLSVGSQRQLSIAFALVEETNDATIAALGDNHEDPSRDDLLAILPQVIDEHGLPLVTLMLAAYASSDARCQAVMGEIIDTDERFVLPDPPPVEGLTGEPAGITIQHRDTKDPEQVEKRTQRKAAKAAKREAEQQRRAADAAAHAARREAQHRAKQQRTKS